MDIKGIAFSVAFAIIFVFAGLIIIRAANGDHLRLLKWCINTSIILLIFSLLISLYNDYHNDKSFDFYAFGVYDTKRFFKDYLFVAGNLIILILQVLMKLVVRWRGVNNSIMEQKLNTFIIFSLFIFPLLEIGFAGSLFNLW